MKNEISKEGIKLAAWLFKGKEIAIEFYQERYEEELKPYTRILSLVMKANNLEAIPALSMIRETEHYKQNILAQIMYIAAVVEIIIAEGIIKN